MGFYFLKLELHYIFTVPVLYIYIYIYIHFMNVHCLFFRQSTAARRKHITQHLKTLSSRELGSHPGVLPEVEGFEMLRDVFAPSSGALPVLCPKIVPHLNWCSKSLRVNLHCYLYSM